jgi:hypothetical protein
MTALAETLSEQVGLKRACALLNVPRSRVYRARQPQAVPTARPVRGSALSAEEREEVRYLLNSDRF